MKKNKKSSGLTLIEIIIAMAMLGVILVAYLSVFTSGYVRIINMGNKTAAMTAAQEIVDSNSYSGLVSYADYDAMIAAPYDSVNDINGRYCTTSGVLTPDLADLSPGSYDTITVMIFYQNGKDFITLTALAP